MDVMSGLLSALVQTRSIEQVLAPIAAQVSQLVIINEAYESGETSMFSSNVLQSAEQVMKASDELVIVANKVVMTTEDQELKSQMPSACELLGIAAKNLVMSTQRVLMEPHRKEVRRNVVRKAKDVLEGTMKVLLVTDESQVRRIVQTAHFLIDRTTLLESVKSMKTLVPCFKGFTEAVILLTKLVERRQKELTHPRQRECLITAITLLKKSVPMLNSSLQTYVKYLDNTQAKASRDYVIKEIISVTHDIINAVENKLMDDEFEDPEEIGHFVSKIDEILNYLSPEQRFILSRDFEILWEGIVRHGMAVAHLATEDQRSLIIKNCQQIMIKKTKLYEQLKNVQSNPTFAELRADFDDCCEELITEFHDLERHINMAVLSLIVDTFNETIEPLERLMKAALSPSKHKTPLKEQKCLDILEPFTEDFNLHSDKMCQVGWFIAASSTDSRRVRIIRSCVRRLEKLDPEILPSTIACRKDFLDKGAVEHLRLLRQEWSNEITTLVGTIDEIVDPKLFIEVSESRLKDYVQLCKDSTYLKDSSELVDVTRSVIGRSNRIAYIAKQIVENHDDPLYRNGLLVYVTQLDKAISGVKSASQYILSNGDDSQAHQVLHKRCDVLLKCVHKVYRGLETSNQPNILDPSRKNVRSLHGLKSLDLDDPSIPDDMLPKTNSNSERNFYLSLELMDSKKKDGVSASTLESFTEGKYMSYSPKIHSEESHSSLVRDLVRAAIGMDSTKVNLLCNDVLCKTNNLLEVGNNIIISCPDQQIRESLREVISEVTRLAPQLIEKGKRVSNNDIDALEPLHNLAKEWSTKMKELEGIISKTLYQWSSIAEKVTDSAKLSNNTILTPEIRNLEAHEKAIKRLISRTRQVTASSNAFGNEKLQIINDFGNDVESLTMSFATIADIVAKTGHLEDTQQMESVSRDWAAKMYCTTATVEQLCSHLIKQYKGCCRRFDGDFSDYVKETRNLKDMLINAISDCLDCSKQEQANCLLQDLDKCTIEMTDLMTIIKQSPTVYPSIEQLYCPQQLLVLQSIWTNKAQLITRLVDELTADYSEPLYKIAYAAFAVHSASAVTRKSCLQDFESLTNQFEHNFTKLTELTLKGVQLCDDLDQKAGVRRCLDRLGDITPAILKVAKQLTDNTSDEHMLEFNQLRRQWACNAQELAKVLNGMQGVQRDNIQEVLLLLKKTLNQKIRQNSSATDTSLVPHNIMSPAKSTQTEAIDSPAVKVSTFSIPPLRINEPSNKPVARPVVTNMVSPSRLFSSGGADDFKSSDTSGVELSTSFSIAESPRKTEKSMSFASPHPRQAISFSEPSRRVQVLPPLPPNSASKQQSQPSRAISAAAKFLRYETEKWEDESNPIVRIAREMARQMQTMAEFTQLYAPQKESRKPELITTAKAIAKNGENIVKFAKVIAEYCHDKRCAKDLMFYADHIPTMSTQLSIISSVKAATPEDRTADKVLVKNAENLMKAVSKTLKASEAACVKGLRQPPKEAIDETHAVVLATQWRRKLVNHRRLESSSADTDDLGLRIIRRHNSGPLLSEILLRK